MGPLVSSPSTRFTMRLENETTEKKANKNPADVINGLGNACYEKVAVSLTDTDKRRNFKTNVVQPDPKSGQNVQIPLILQHNAQQHIAIGSTQSPSPVSIIPVNSLNGGNGFLHQPHALLSGQNIVQKCPTPMVNGLNYAMVMQANDQPSSFVALSTPVSSAMYTSPPAQLMGTPPTIISHERKVSPSTPMKYETVMVSTASSPAVESSGASSVPPPLVPINTMNHSMSIPQKFNFVVQSAPSESLSEKFRVSNSARRNSQNGIVYLPSPPPTYQKLVILPVMMSPTSGQDSANTIVVPMQGGTNGNAVMPSTGLTVVNNKLTANIIPEGYEESSSMPIYRFNAMNSIQPVQFVPAHVPLGSSAKDIESA